MLAARKPPSAPAVITGIWKAPSRQPSGMQTIAIAAPIASASTASAAVARDHADRSSSGAIVVAPTSTASASAFCSPAGAADVMNVMPSASAIITRRAAARRRLVRATRSRPANRRSCPSAVAHACTAPAASASAMARKPAATRPATARLNPPSSGAARARYRPVVHKCSEPIRPENPSTPAHSNAAARGEATCWPQIESRPLSLAT